jgi:hypothetical protein
MYLDGALYAGPNDGQQAPLHPGQDGDRLPSRASLLSLKKNSSKSQHEQNVSGIFQLPSLFIIVAFCFVFLNTDLLVENSLFSVVL